MSGDGTSGPVSMQVDAAESASSVLGKAGQPLSNEQGEVAELSHNLGGISLGDGTGGDLSLAKRPRIPVPVAVCPSPASAIQSQRPKACAPMRPCEMWMPLRQIGIPTPSIADLEPTQEAVGLPVPPLPRFSSASARPQVRVMVDGVERVRHIGRHGGIHVGEAQHFSIGLDNEGEELPCFGEGRARGSNNPFEPGAGSPFKPVVAERVVGQLDISGEVVSPPPPARLPESPPRTQRRRSPSPKTPVESAPTGLCKTLPCNSRRNKDFAGPPPPSPPVGKPEAWTDNGSIRSSPSQETPDSTSFLGSVPCGNCQSWVRLQSLNLPCAATIGFTASNLAFMAWLRRHMCGGQS